MIYEIFFFTKFCFDFFYDSLKHILSLVQVLERIRKGCLISIYNSGVIRPTVDQAKDKK
jgi:hypothetical protein